MTSKADGFLTNLEADLPTTAEDVAALQLARRATGLTPEAYARLLEQLGDVPPEKLRRRKGPRGEPFELPPAEDRKI